jgi:two-component system sensor histidine kinase KdpD
MTNEPSERSRPEQLLAQVEREERRLRQGRLKVFLGYASGVGKSFQMFDEGRRRRERGEDVVVCATQAYYTPEVDSVLRQLESIPALKLGEMESIDIPAILARRPQVALIDGLAYENPPGSLNRHRWEDVEQLLDAGISVVTTLNLQYLEKLCDQVERITGKCTPCILPRGFLDRSADDIVVVDAPALESLARGGASAGGSVSLEEEHKLSQLRELALLVAAAVVDHQLENCLRSHGMGESWGVQERILVCLAPHFDATRMLESGRRNADRFNGELYVTYTKGSVSREDRQIFQQNLDLAARLGSHAEMLEGRDEVDEVLELARRKGITQIFIGDSARQSAWPRVRNNLLDRLIRSAEGIDVIVYPR